MWEVDLIPSKRKGRIAPRVSVPGIFYMRDSNRIEHTAMAIAINLRAVNRTGQPLYGSQVQFIEITERTKDLIPSKPSQDFIDKT